MKEKVILFGKNNNLVGILTENGKATGNPNIIFLNAGLIHRVGPNRIYVHLAREVAKYGYTSFRFDFSGIGDSDPLAGEDDPFEIQAVAEVKKAMDYLEMISNIKKFIIFGICSGADIALKAAVNDKRVVGLILINGFFLSNAEFDEYYALFDSDAKKRYYRKNMFSYKSWLRILLGKSDYKSIMKIATHKIMQLLKVNGNGKTNGNGSQNGNGKTCDGNSGSGISYLKQKYTEALVIYTEGSLALDCYHMLHQQRLEGNSSLEVKIMEDVDHVLTPAWSQNWVVNLVVDWLQTRYKNCFECEMIR